MIYIEGNYLFDIQVGKYKNFLHWDDLIEFTSIEDSGCVLPVVDLIFKFNLDDVRNYLVQNNVVTITFGTSYDDMRTFSYRIYNQNVSKHGNGYWLATLYLMYDAVPFLQGTQTKSYKGNSVSVIHDVVSPYFNFQTNVTTDNSNQTWLQCRESTRDFVTNTWLHASIPDSFPAVAITKDGKFKYRDMVKDMRTESKWIFSYKTPSQPREIRVSGSPELLNDTGTVNILTQSKRNLIYDMESGKTEEYILERQPMLANTTNIEEVTSDPKDSTKYMTNSNVHTSYWDSYSRNVGLLTYFSGVRVVISYLSYLRDDMEVLDIASFLDHNQINAQETEGLYSGKYIISKIVRTIDANKNLQTHIVLSRESLNEVRDYAKEISKIPTTITTDAQYQEGKSVLSKALSRVRSLLLYNGMNLTVPTFRIILDELLGVNISSINNIGYDFNSIWIRLGYLLSLSDNSLLKAILNTLFKLLMLIGQVRAMTSEHNVMTSLNSGRYSRYISDGYITIPNVGITSIDPKEYSASIFSWHVSDTINSNTKTGDSDLDNLLQQSIDFIKNDAIIGVTDVALFTRYWGNLNTESMNISQLSSLYREQSNVKEFHKKMSSNNGYLYYIYPEFIGESTFTINGTTYTNMDMDTMEVVNSDNTITTYLVYRTKDKFNGTVSLEVK